MPTNETSHPRTRRTGDHSAVSTRYRRRSRHGRITVAAVTAALAVPACAAPTSDVASEAAEVVQPSANQIDDAPSRLPDPASEVARFDEGPPWQPDQVLLDEMLEEHVVGDVAVVEPGGGSAPIGPPNWSALGDAEVREPGGLPAPTWQPNYGRLETVVGAGSAAGPR